MDAVRRAGGRATLLLPGDDRTPAELLDGVEALLLTRRRGRRPVTVRRRHRRDEFYGVEPDRDALEIDLVGRSQPPRDAHALHLSRHAGDERGVRGSLIQDLPSDQRFMPHGAPSGSDAVVHDVKLAGDSAIARATGSDVVACSSHHHQGVDQAGPGVVATGWSEDGLVEAIELERGWMLGVQWHPEDTAPNDEAQQGLFDELIRRARGAKKSYYPPTRLTGGAGRARR